MNFQNKIPDDDPKSIDVESKVILNKTVTKITYDQLNTAGDRVQVDCADGSEYFCDHLICTISLGVLKKECRSLFKPTLPMYKIDCIDAMGFGTVDKIFIEFTKPFWTDGWEGVSFLWKPEQMVEINEDPVNGEWLSKIIGFYTVSFQPNILCGWITGQAACKMEQVADDDVKTGVERVLKLFVNDWKDAKVKKVIRYVTLEDKY